MDTKLKLLTRRNKVILIITYLLVATFLSIAILDKSNEAVRTLEQRLILMTVNLLVAAPGFAMGVLLVILRTQYFIQTRNPSDFMNPPKGSPGNPNINDIVGEKGIKFLNVVVIGLILISVGFLCWLAFSVLKAK